MGEFLSLEKGSVWSFRACAFNKTIRELEENTKANDDQNGFRSLA